jgi:hypothetical protein
MLLPVSVWDRFIACLRNKGLVSHQSLPLSGTDVVIVSGDGGRDIIRSLVIMHRINADTHAIHFKHFLHVTSK